MDTFYAVDAAWFLFQETKSSQTKHIEQSLLEMYSRSGQTSETLSKIVNGF